MNNPAITAQASGNQDPSLSALLERIDLRLARLEAAAASIDAIARGAPGVVATLTDAFDAHAAHLAQGGADVDERVRAMVQLAVRLTAPATVAAMEMVLDSGLLEPRALDSLGRVAQALASTGQTAPAPVGAWGALRALGDPDIQRALGLVLAIAKQLGRSLASPSVAPQLPPPAQGD